MFRRADLVFVTSEKLRQRATTFTPRVHLFPFGVKYDAFEAVRESPRRTPADMAGLTRPRSSATSAACISGSIRTSSPKPPRSVATPHSSSSAHRNAICRDWKRRRIKLLGAKPHSELPHYVREFDVGLVP
jgi:hypothetical protein